MTLSHERLERLAALRREGILTDAEYDAKRAALIDDAVAGAPVLARSGRNTRHVMWGFLFGMPFGLLSIAFLLTMPRGKKREDAMFGAWFGMAAGGLLLAVTAGLAVAMTGIRDRSSTSPSTHPAASMPTEVPSLLTASEAERIVQDDRWTVSLRATGGGWRLCDQARYQAADRTWVVTCKFSDERAGPVVDTQTYLLDDRTGKKIR